MEVTLGDHVPKTASEAVVQQQLSEGRREKSARHISLEHSWEQERQSALAIRMAGGGEVGVGSASGSQRREEQTAAELEGHQTTRV